MRSSSLRFRRKQGFAEPTKPDGRPRKDAIIIPSCGKFSGPSSGPSNGKSELHSKLSSAKEKLVVHDNQNSVKKRKFEKIEPDPTNGCRKNTSHINFETSSRRKSSNLDVLALSLSPPNTNTNRKKEPSKQEVGSSSPSYQKSNHGFTIKVEPVELGPVLILMSCLSCYIHVMVSDANPKCPKCGKGDCLLDMFRVSPLKKARMVKFE